MRPIWTRFLLGATLLELMIVLIVVGVVTSIAAPTFGNLIITTKISQATSALHSSLLFARSEALKRGRNVVICRSSNPSALAPNCAATSGAGWGQGWIIYVDEDGNKKFTSADILIRMQDAIFSTEAQGNITSSPTRNYISYNPTGQTFGSFIRFTIHRPESDMNTFHDKFICIASGGRARVDNDTCTGK
jgi:type IV fimbrial biogenesis protein FimT